MNDVVLRATRRDWLGLCVLTIPILVVAMDISVLYLALPALVEDLKPTSTQTLWILDIYGFFLAGLLITMGSVGDRIGRRRLLLTGAVTFGLASFVAAFSTFPIMLILSRALLGIGGATLAPSTLSLIRNMFHDPPQRRIAIGLWTAGFAGGSAIGPVIGGFLLEHFWWGSVFLINVPIMAGLLVAAPFLVPEFMDPTADRLDPLSVVMSISAMLGIVYAIKHGAEYGVDTLTICTSSFGIIIGVLFIHRLRRSANALIDLSLFRSRSFTLAIFVQFLAIFALAGFSLFASQYLQLIVGLGPMSAGLWLMIPAGAAAIGAVCAPVLSGISTTRTVIILGLCLITVGALTLAFVTPNSGAALLMIGMSLLTLGVGASSTLNSDIVLNAAAPEKAGTASAMSETGAELGGAVGIAVLGTIGTTIYRNATTDDLPIGIPADLAGRASETIGGGLVVAENLSPPLNKLLTNVATSSFVDGLNYAAAGYALAMVLCTFIVYWVLRN